MLRARSSFARACASASAVIALARPAALIESPWAWKVFFCSSFCAVSACCCMTFFVLIASITVLGARSSLIVNCFTWKPYGANRFERRAKVRLVASAFLGPITSATGSWPITSCSAWRMVCFTYPCMIRSMSVRKVE